MNNVNRVIVGGNLTRDPELRYMPTGTAVCDICIAVNRSYKDKTGALKEEVSYVDVTVFAKTAEVCGEHLKKGRPVLIDGSLRQERWEAPDGAKRSHMKVIASVVHFLGPKPGSGEGGAKKEEATAQAPAQAGAEEMPEPPF